jgi:hypothetical protein
MSYTDEPIPVGANAQFAAWKKKIGLRLDDLERHSTIVTPEPISGTTDASGFFTFFHGAFQVPKAIMLQPEAPSGGTNIFVGHVVDSITDQTARVRAINQTGGALVSIAITFRIVVFI